MASCPFIYLGQNNHVAKDNYLLMYLLFLYSVKVLDEVRLSSAPVLSKLGHPCSKQGPVYFMNQYAQGLVDT